MYVFIKNCICTFFHSYVSACTFVCVRKGGFSLKNSKDASLLLIITRRKDPSEEKHNICCDVWILWSQAACATLSINWLKLSQIPKSNSE